jgi:hypothetical protein
MAAYRIYGLSRNGDFAWVVEANCASDADACLIARALPWAEREREIWRGETWVGHVARDRDASVTDEALLGVSSVLH